MRLRCKSALLMYAILVGAAVPVAGEEPFFDGTFDEACRVAKEKNKVIMIDFYTTWCGPCRMLDRYTWPDAKVKQWLTENTVPMKVDAERNRELAFRYKVRSYPTMVFLKADGVEISRTVGFQQPTMFLTNAARIIAPKEAVVGNPAISNVKPVMAANPNMLDRMKRGRELAAAGKPAEALADWLWCFDNGESEGPGLTRIRLTTLLTEIANLGKTYPPAQAALQKRRDAAEKTLLAEKVAADDPEAVKNLTMTALEFASINRATGEVDRTIAVHEALNDRGEPGRDLQRAMFNDMLDVLLRTRRYQDIVNLAGDVFDRVNEKIARYEENGRRQSGLNRKSQENLALYLRQQVVAEAGKYYEALLGTGRLNEAEQLADRVLKFDPSATAYMTLVEHAVRAKAYDPAKSLIARAEKALRPGEASMVRKAGSGMPQS